MSSSAQNYSLQKNGLTEQKKNVSSNSIKLYDMENVADVAAAKIEIENIEQNDILWEPKEEEKIWYSKRSFFQHKLFYRLKNDKNIVKPDYQYST